MEVQIKKLRPDAEIPRYQKSGDAGFDFYCVERAVVPPNSVAILPTGLAIAVPPGYELQLRLRSGAALATPLILANAPGTIDSGYRGEIGIIVRNLSAEPWIVEKGTRLAQGVLAPVYTAKFIEVKDLPPSERGAGGFGSTGKN